MRSHPWARGTIVACLVPFCLGWHLCAVDVARGQEKAVPSKKATKDFGSWAEVIERLSERTGLPFIASAAPPAGVPDAGLKKDAPVPELIDAVNERLMPRNLIVIRRDKSLTIAKTDEPIDLAQLRQVKSEELAGLGKTELVALSVRLQNQLATDLVRDIRKLLSPLGTVRVVDAANALFLSDAAGNLRHVMKLIAEVTQPRVAPAAAPARKSAVLQTHAVPPGSAERLAQLFQEMLKDSVNVVRVGPLGSDQILVLADPEGHLTIAKVLAQPARAVVATLTLSNLDAVRVADTLRGMFGEPNRGGPYVEADPLRGVLIVRGTPEQVQELKATVQTLDEGSGPRGANIRVLNLERDGAATMAEALRNLLQGMRPNPVRVVVPTEQAAPGDKSPAAGKKAGKDMTITLTAAGSRLIVTSDDSEALALVVELTRLLRFPAGEGDFEIIRLKHARADNVARIIDEVFNASARPARMMPSATTGGTLGAGAGFAVTARVGRVRVVADPATNTLLLKAAPLDVLTIRSLVTRALDVPELTPPGRDP